MINQPYALANTFKRKKYLKYGLGSYLDPKLDPSITGAAATMGSGIIDTLDEGNQYGRQHIGSSAAKGALTGAAAGSIIPGIGTVVGGLIGGTIGLIKGIKAKHAEGIATNSMEVRRKQAENNYMSAKIAADPSLYQGYKDSEYFANGGNMGGVPAPTELSHSQLKLFKQWKAKLPKNLQYEGDYDLKGFYKENPNFIAAEGQHMTDKFKLPNHPTFSNESRYYDQTVPGAGGYWKDDSYVPNPKIGAPIPKMMAGGGQMDDLPLDQPTIGGELNQKSSDGAEVEGKSHEAGGVKMPGMGTEVEGDETLKGSYVFSKRLGFADKHRPIMLAKGKIEKKPFTRERATSIKLLDEQEHKLILAQEYLKHQLNLK